LHDRGITDDAIDEFKLGYSDKSFGDLKSFLKNSGIPNDIFLSTGLVRMKDGVLYEMFRGRIIIPIIDVNKKIIGFGGRTIEKEGFPKYINSPESAVFSKRVSLFGIDKTRKFISDSNEVFIVEGYFDFISLFMHGFKNVVSTLGTAVTEGQISKLRNYTENITLLLDGDEAGIKSALRLIELFAEMGINGNMVVLPEAHDPDSFIRKEGMEALQGVVTKKKPILDYYFDYSVERHGIKTPEGKNLLIKAVLPYVGAIRNAVTRRLYVKRISELTGVEENHFAHLQNEETKAVRNDNGSSKGVIVEKRVINACMTNPYLLEPYKGKEVLSYIKNRHVREVLSRILYHIEEKRDFEVHSFIQTLEDDDLRSLVLDAVFHSAEFVDDEPEKVFFDYFRYVEKQFFKEESKKITERLSEAERRGDEKEITELLKQKRQF
jgi:DNA primase